MLDTKLRIAESLLELLEKDELMDIQISEIADKAEVSDRTIRRYFKGKESILRFFVEYLISSIDVSEVTSTITASMKYIDFWFHEKELVELFRKRDILYILILGNMEYSKKSLNTIFDEMFDFETYFESKKYMIDLIVHMEVSLFETWVYNDYNLSLEEAKSKLVNAYEIFKGIEF